ncbi:YolD-like family protein [Desmospora activa]|uniref:YolD-like protein n=1 Tax=Desmospora activa DSM 45169 TaxID=1121389 RepID=A0A2T4YYC0_9BACL|nr:YolD-like family protein [Desmospora activa]PTM51712.1 YolD-like protein [Desmospora activa DSM 45169]
MDLNRGNKLWEGNRIILPEHEESLWQAQRKSEEYQPPELDPDALEEIGRIIAWSKLEEQAIEVTYAAKYGTDKYIGHVVRIDPVERWLILQNGEDKKLFPFSIIIGAEKMTDYL